jgi:hypothetical protein
MDSPEKYILLVLYPERKEVMATKLGRETGRLVLLPRESY